MTRGPTAALAFALITLATPPIALAQADYPNRPLTVIVPFPPGGATDILARLVGKQMSDVFKQSVVVENRAGAGGTVGSRVVAKAEPNGYTLLMGTNASHAISVSLFANPGYDPVKDFQPIGLVALVPQVLMVHPSLPINNVRELIAYAKQRPGSLNFGSAGNGTPGHLGLELFKMKTGADMVHVPFQGGAPALTALAGAQVQLMADNVNSALPQVRAGKVRGIAVTSAKRSQALPDLPTIAEQGVADFDSGSWFAMYAPAGVPAPIVARLNRELNAALAHPEVREAMVQQGAEAQPGSPDDLGRLMRADIAKWAEVTKQVGIKPQ